MDVGCIVGIWLNRLYIVVLVKFCVFHHKHCSSDWKDLTFGKFTSQKFSRTNVFLKGRNASATAVIWLPSYTEHSFVHPFYIYGKAINITMRQLANW